MSVLFLLRFYCSFIIYDIFTPIYMPFICIMDDYIKNSKVYFNYIYIFINLNFINVDSK